MYSVESSPNRKELHMTRAEHDKARSALADTFGDEWSGSLRAPRTVDLMTDRLRENILSGSLEIGSPLPAERILATNFSVNRHTVRSALATLPPVISSSAPISCFM